MFCGSLNAGSDGVCVVGLVKVVTVGIVLTPVVVFRVDVDAVVAVVVVVVVVVEVVLVVVEVVVVVVVVVGKVLRVVEPEVEGVTGAVGNAVDAVVRIVVDGDVDEDDDVLGVVGLVVGVVVEGAVGIIVVISGFMQLLGRATSPLNKPTMRMQPKPPAIPAASTGVEISNAFLAPLTPIMFEANN